MMIPNSKIVLVIEDNTDIREGVKDILELADYKVYVAEDGKKGVEMAQSYIPDLILCDIMMPELDGYGVLYLLGKHEATINIPFIFLSARAERTDLRKGMELGADDYVTKPFTDMELLNAIEARLNKNKRSTKNSDSIDSLINEAQSVRLLKELSENSRTRSYKQKQNIYMDGDLPLNVFMVRNGRVRTYITSPDGREITTGMFLKGDFFGYNSVLLNKAGTDNAEALDISELYLISKEEFNALIFKDHGISKKFIRLLSGNVQEKQDQLLKLAYNSVRKRVADALVDLAEKYGESDADNAVIKISRDELASLAGTAKETISRVLADFKSEKMIEKEGSSISVFSIRKLKKTKQ